MNETPIRIAGAGICCLDHIVVAPKVAWGDTAPVREYCVEGGGLVATALAACARLGAATELFSLLGEDAVADQVLEGLHAEGVSTGHVARVSTGASPFSFIHVDAENGERTIFHRRAVGLDWGARSLDALADADAVVVDGYYPDLARAAVAEARKHRVPTIVDTTPSDANRDWLRDVDVVIAPQHYVRNGGFPCVKAALEAIREMGPPTAVITLGGRGWVASDAGGITRGPAFEVAVVDTVGAGDVFHGAYAFGVARRWNTARTAEFASAVAALKCTAVGGRAGIPSLDRALEFLRERSPNDWSSTT